MLGLSPVLVKGQPLEVWASDKALNTEEARDASEIILSKVQPQAPLIPTQSVLMKTFTSQTGRR